MDRDPFLRRIERDAIVACVAMSLIAMVIWWGESEVPLGVLAGGALVAISYSGIKGGVDALARRACERPARIWAFVKFLARYAIVAAAAYLLMVRVRVHPAAVVAGASSLVIAAAAEAIRAARSRTYDNPH